ncbi:hypothetical protein ACB092_06G224000 [Castanea dentata]
MEDKTYLQSFEDLEEDALSLCDLSIHDEHAELEEPNSFSSCTDSPSRPDLFEFSTANPTVKNDTVIFCGRVIHQKHQEEEEECPRRRALWGSESFNKSQKFHSARFTGNNRSSSLRVPATGSFRYQKCESKKHKVIIGLAKIQPQMELSEIRKRQARRGPVPMIPVVVDGREPVIAGNDGGKRSGGTGPAKSHWTLLRCRAHFASVLARATSACFPLL